MNKISILMIALLFSVPSFSSGPITSGGGNLSSDEKAEQGYLEFHLENPFPIHLNLTFNTIYRNYLNGTNGVTGPIWDQFFKNKDLLFTLITAPRIFVNRLEACLDQDGKKTDASIVAPPNYDICLSTATIAGKLSQYQMIPQLVGLVAHEYGHLVGKLSEKDAQHIQFVFMWRATQIGDVHVPLNHVRDNLRHLKNNIESVYLEKYSRNPAALCKLLSDSRQLYAESLYPWNNGPQYLDVQNRAILEVIQAKLSNLQKQACVEAKVYGFEEMKADLDKFYSGNNQQTRIEPFLSDEAKAYFKSNSQISYPWLRRVQISENPEGRYSNYRNSNWLVEVEELSALIESMAAKVESLYWLRIDVDLFPGPAK